MQTLNRRTVYYTGGAIFGDSRIALAVPVNSGRNLDLRENVGPIGIA